MRDRANISLLHDLSVERNTHGAQQETGVLVRLGGGVEGDVATWDHLGRVPFQNVALVLRSTIVICCIKMSEYG